MTIPGRNHTYRLGIPFYTLATPAGEFLSHPQSIIENAWTKSGEMVDPMLQTFSVWDHPITIAITSLWACAWVVYSTDDLRMLYTLLARARRQHGEQRVPSIPYTGIMEVGPYGMIICRRLHQLSSQEVREMRQGEQATQPDVPLTLPLL